MQEQRPDEIREGLTACDRDGTPVGKVTAVHREAPGGAMAPGMGYLEVEVTLTDRTLDLHVPLTRVLQVLPDRVVLELDPDLVAAHDMQVRPAKLPEEL